MWPSPWVFPVPIWWRSHGTAAPRPRVPPIMNKIPFADPSPDRDDHCGGPEPPKPVVPRPKAAFQWPPDCAWPFIDRGRAGDT
jgi:hypothetical protein